MSRATGEREAAIARLKKGQSVRKVAADLKVPKSTVADWRKLAGLDDVKTGVMVAFFLPDDAARQLALDPAAVPGAEPAGDLHLTLAFLGDSGGIKDVGRLRRVVGGFAAMAPPVEGEVSGLGRFANGDKAVYASFDSPTLPEWRQRLVQHLRTAGFAPDTSHGFTPHVTLAYPEGPVQLDVQPLAIAFKTVTLAVAEERWDFPLEGTAALMAEPAGPAEKAPSSASANDMAQAQDQEAGMLQEMMDSQAPPIMDELYLQAWQRYFHLIVNDVPHHRALEAVQHIDPDFEMTDDQARRAIHALGKGEEPVKFANWSRGSVAPPDYVQSVYNEFQYGAGQAQEISDFIFRIAQEAYLEGLNAQLLDMGMPIVDKIDDPAVLAEMRQEVSSIAAGIVDTFHRDLASEVYTAWVELSAQRGTQMSRQWLSEAVAQWVARRTEFKAGQVAMTESYRWSNRGAADFIRNNAARGNLTVERAYVVPFSAECGACDELIGISFSLEEADRINLPLHPNCQHMFDYVKEPADSLSAADLWLAQAESGAAA